MQHLLKWGIKKSCLNKLFLCSSLSRPMRWLCRWEEFHHGKVLCHTFNSYLTAHRHWSNKRFNFSFNRQLYCTNLSSLPWLDGPNCVYYSQYWDELNSYDLSTVFFNLEYSISLIWKCKSLLTSFDHFCWGKIWACAHRPPPVIELSACRKIDTSCWSCDVDKARWRSERPCSWHHQAIWSQRVQARRNQGILLCLNYTCIWNSPYLICFSWLLFVFFVA